MILQPSLKMSPVKVPAARVLKDIRRQMRRHFSAEDKIRIVLDDLSVEHLSGMHGNEALRVNALCGQGLSKL
jgi:ribosomal protein L31E